MSQREGKTELIPFGPNNHSKYVVGWRAIDTSTKEACDTILKHYGIEVTQEIKQVDEWERMSNNFRVTVITHGNAAKQYLLRKHIKWNNKDDIRSVDRILLFLDSNGLLPVPVLIPAINGSTFIYQDDHFWQMYEFIEGDHYHGTHQELKNVAENIAKMHTLLAQAPFVEEIKRKSKPRPPWTREGWMDILKNAQRRETWVDVLLDDNREIVMSAMDAVEPHLEAMKKSPQQIIHRDLHPWNTLYQDNRLRALLDFSDAHFGELLRDISYACHRFVRQYVVFQGRNKWQSILHSGINLFIKAYNTVTPTVTTTNEAVTVSAFMADELLTKTLANLSDYYIKGTDKTVTDGELQKKLTLLQEALIIGKQLVIL